MNHIAKHQEITAKKVASGQSPLANSSWFLSLLIIAMVAHALIAYAKRPFESDLLLELLFGAVNFAMVLLMYYGIARVAFCRQYVFLGVASLIAISIGIILSSQIPAISMAAGWLTILLSAIICGELAVKGVPLPKVFGAAVCAVILFSAVQLYPLWSKLFESAADLAKMMMADLGEALTAVGYSESVAQNLTEQIGGFYEILLRIIPSLSLMAAMFQFALAFWLFVTWLIKRGGSTFGFPKFISWKIPFALTVILLAGILMRLLGNDFLTLVADNMILILAVVYSIAGIAMLEFFMKKFRFGGISRFLIYFLLLVTHIIGFAFLGLVGFVDSFFDWRRKYPLPLDYKTG